jgi:L-ribulokinase
MPKYAIGIDFGTESARALLVDVSNGKEVATAAKDYPHGVIDEQLPSGPKVGKDWALQHPEDWLKVLRSTVRKVVKDAGVEADDVVGLGIDCTACTMLPTTAEGKPLCLLKRYEKNPNAWPKLWKHHAAQDQADRINATARKQGFDFIDRYGGKLSSEWLYAKTLQTLEDAPRIYHDAARFIEAADWIVWQMTGQETRNVCTAGYKAGYEPKRGAYPPREFFAAVHPDWAGLVDDKLSRDISPQGTKAGGLTPEMAKALRLSEGTPVAVGNVDAHVAVPAATITQPGKMLMIMGTSICHMVMGTKERKVEGMCGSVWNGILEGYYGFEAGQSGAGDILAWFVDNAVPPEVHREARKQKSDVHAVLEERASNLRVGESGLLALDWLYGNRSVLVDVDLSGMLLGLTIATRPEEIYRALIEALAFGTRTIIDAFEDSGVPVTELYACGGLPYKNKLLMQIFADVTGRPIRIARSEQTCALGSAMFGAVAAGKKAGGHDTIEDAAKRMAGVLRKVFRPKSAHQQVYERLYAEYHRLHDYFGRGENPVMKTLKALHFEQAKKRRR